MFKYLLMFILLAVLSAAPLSCSKNPASSDGREAGNSSELAENDPVPVKIEQVSPNPFQTVLLIKIRLEKKLYINLRILGEGVQIILINEVRDEGVHYYIFEPPDWIPSGRYRVTLEEVGRGRLDVLTVQYIKRGNP